MFNLFGFSDVLIGFKNHLFGFSRDLFRFTHILSRKTSSRVYSRRAIWVRLVFAMLLFSDENMNIVVLWLRFFDEKTISYSKPVFISVKVFLQLHFGLELNTKTIPFNSNVQLSGIKSKLNILKSPNSNMNWALLKCLCTSLCSCLTLTIFIVLALDLTGIHFWLFTC